MPTPYRRRIRMLAGLALSTLAVSGCASLGGTTVAAHDNAAVPQVATAPVLAPVKAVTARQARRMKTAQAKRAKVRAARAKVRAAHLEHLSKVRARGHDHRPNVLMIVVDDASPANMKHMPNVRHLIGHRGVTFTNGVAPTPICVPARASLLTGQYATNHGARSISGPHAGFKALRDRETLPVWLHRAGYDTMFIGKYLNGYGDSPSLTGPRGRRTYVPPGWTDWRGTVGLSTYNYVHPTINHNGHLSKPRVYNSNLFNRYTVRELSQKRRTEHPWFMMVNYVAPHAGGPKDTDDVGRGEWPLGSPYVAPRYRNAFKNLPLPSTPDMFEADTSDKAARATHRVIPMHKREYVAEDYRQRVESLLSVDAAVAKAVATLRRTHQLHNTVILFSSDNGYLMGQHNEFAKPRYFEESQTVPMLMTGPGIPRGVKVATPVTNPDLATTIAAIAHARPGIPQDGLDVRPLLTEPTMDRVVPIQAWQAKDGDKEKYRGVRTLIWTYVRLPGGGEELYNRREDPYELENRAGDPAYADALGRMRELTAKYIDCRGSACPAPQPG